MQSKTSNDSKSYEVPLKSAKLSGVVTDFFDEVDDDDEAEMPEIPLPLVTGDILKMVVDFLEQYEKEPMTEIEKPLKSSDMGDLVQKWYADFLDPKRIDQKTLFEVILAANYMNVEPLLDLGCMTVASMMRGKTAEDIRETFGIENDLSPEEEAQIIAENVWTEEP